MFRYTERKGSTPGEDGTSMQRDLVQSVDRAMQILLAFDSEAQELSINELSRRVRLSKSTVHRLLTTLATRSFVEQNNQNGKYRLGLALYELGTQTILARSFVAEAEPFLKEIVGLYGETASLSVLEDIHSVIVEKFESSAALRLTSQIGRRSHLHTSASGKVLLAYQPSPLQEELIARLPLPRFTPNTITDPRELKRHLAEIRRRGYAVDNEEVSEDLICIGAPVFNHSGQVVAAISASGLASRVRQAGVERIAATLVAAGLSISSRLGFSPEREGVEAEES